MDKKYYFITVFNSYDDCGPHNMRCWGFYTSFEEADLTLRNNLTDLWETCYDYGVIEEYYEGIGSYTFNRWFYKYKQRLNQYTPINEPEELKHYANFALG